MKNQKRVIPWLIALIIFQILLLHVVQLWIYFHRNDNGVNSSHTLTELRVVRILNLDLDDSRPSFNNVSLKKEMEPENSSISEMNEMMQKSYVSYVSPKPQWPTHADKELLNARRLIESAEIVHDHNRSDDLSVYRNYSRFIRSHELMVRTLKIYVYSEGERPVFHEPWLHGIYASEGWFMKQLEENKHFITKDAEKAHLFYLPFSSRQLRSTLIDDAKMVLYLSSYLQNLTTKYPFWNRTSGADHFLAACHDWAPAQTEQIMKNCIRSLCNADITLGFQFGKDVSLPETNVRDPNNPLKGLETRPAARRPILGFFAGQMHGYLRPKLLHYWENKDPEMKIFGKLNESNSEMGYEQYMKSSKYCINARGNHGYTPRIMEAIFYECVPVFLSDNYIPPFFETLNWESFSVFVPEKDVRNLRKILASISEERYLKMQQRVRQVRKHFLWHSAPVEQDIFYMILHSVWNTRIFQTRWHDFDSG